MFSVAVFRLGVTVSGLGFPQYTTHTGKTMAEKSGYQIREDLLHLAYQIVVTNAQGRFEATMKDKRETGEWPVFGVQDVIKAARELNAFVSENKRTE